MFLDTTAQNAISLILHIQRIVVFAVLSLLIAKYQHYTEELENSENAYRTVPVVDLTNPVSFNSALDLLPYLEKDVVLSAKVFCASKQNQFQINKKFFVFVKKTYTAKLRNLFHVFGQTESIVERAVQFCPEFLLANSPNGIGVSVVPELFVNSLEGKQNDRLIEKRGKTKYFGVEVGAAIVAIGKLSASPPIQKVTAVVNKSLFIFDGLVDFSESFLYNDQHRQFFLKESDKFLFKVIESYSEILEAYESALRTQQKLCFLLVLTKRLFYLYQTFHLLKAVYFWSKKFRFYLQWKRHKAATRALRNFSAGVCTNCLENVTNTFCEPCLHAFLCWSCASTNKPRKCKACTCKISKLIKFY